MVRAQSSVEFMLILAAVMILAIITLSGASSQLRLASNFSENATRVLDLSTASLLSNLSAGSSAPYPPSGGGGGEAYPELELELYVPMLYVGEPSIVQATIWNYGGAAAEVAELELMSSDQARLPLSPTGESGIRVGISHTLSAVATPNAAGTYTLSATAYGEDGEPLRAADGSLLRKNATVLVLLPGWGGTPGKPTLNYNISFARSDEKIAYATIPSQESVKMANAVIRPMSFGMEGYMFCDCVGAWARWGYVDYSTGQAEWKCGCLYYINSANVSMVSTTPQYSFRNLANITNATNSSQACEVSQDAASCTLQAGTARLSGDVSATGPSPASDSVAAALIGNSTWRLRSLSAYNSYLGALNSLSTVATTVNGNMYCSRNCAGIMDAAAAVEAQRNSLLGSTPSSAASCTANSTAVSCNATSFSYPTMLFSLNSSFLGGHIPQANPDKFTVSGIEVEVSTD